MAHEGAIAEDTCHFGATCVRVKLAVDPFRGKNALRSLHAEARLSVLIRMSERRGSRLRAGLVFLVLSCFLATARAEKIPSSTAELTAAATLIVEGTVEAIQAERSLELPWEYVRYHALVKVTKVTKGDALGAGDAVGCRYWTKHWRAPTSPPPDTSGHWPLPQSGQVVRVYLVAAGYNGFGQTTDGGYDVFGRNGWEILSTPAAPTGGVAYYDTLESDWRRKALAITAAGVGLILIFWFVRRRRRR